MSDDASRRGNEISSTGDILWQFLTEAMTLTAVGGILGILIGAGAAFLINTFSPFPAVIQTTWVLVALFVSLAVGLTTASGPRSRPRAWTPSKPSATSEGRADGARADLADALRDMIGGPRPA